MSACSRLRVIAVNGAGGTPVPVCPVRDAVLVGGCCHGNREHNKVSRKVLTPRGLANFLFSLWENKSKHSFKQKKKKNGALLIYRIYFFCTFIYRLIYSNRFFSSFRALLWSGRDFNLVKKATDENNAVRWRAVFFFLKCFVLFF